MLDIKFIRDNQKKVKDGLVKKNVQFQRDGKKTTVDEFIQRILTLDGERLAHLRELEGLKAEQNLLSATIAKLSDATRTAKVAESAELKHKIAGIETLLCETATSLEPLMYQMPNIPADDAPVGKSEKENVVVREVGDKRSFSFKPRDYMALGDTLDLIDTERAAKVSGSRFGYLKHEAPLLEFAFVQFAFSRLIREEFIRHIVDVRSLGISTKPFIPVVPPVMIRPEVYRGMGRLDPGQEEERYFLPKDNLYLVGSSEHTTGPMHMGEAFAKDSLPHRHIAFSTCFRREAGSYGKDTKGILRVHQFDKVELFSFADPGSSNTEHELLLGIQEAFMKELKLPYRAVLICTGDMGWPDAKQYDIEAWMPGQNQYRETHSASNTTDFQSRRLGIRYKNAEGKNELLHMLNATALAIGRMLIAILENYQNEDGSVDVPEALVPYMHGITRITPRKQ